MGSLKDRYYHAIDTNLPPLIVVHGLAGAGKSTLASALLNRGYVAVKIASPLKDMLRNLLRDAGVDENRIERMIEGDLKEVPCDELDGRTPRHAMQTLGTTWGRDCMHPDFWVRKATQRIARILNNGYPVVVDDLRFPNEAALLRQMNGILWKVVRQKALGEDMQHVSEEGLPDSMFDRVFYNTGTVFDLHQGVEHELYMASRRRSVLA